MGMMAEMYCSLQHARGIHIDASEPPREYEEHSDATATGSIEHNYSVQVNFTGQTL